MLKKNVRHFLLGIFLLLINISLTNSGSKNKINIRIQFCQSWSHRGYFGQVKQALESNFKNIDVLGENYPLPTNRKILSTIVTLLQFGGIGIFLLWNVVSPYLQKVISEENMKVIDENKTMIGIMLFFVCNFINGQISNTGAFEIFCNDKLIFSAVEHGGKVIQINELIRLIRANA